MSFIFFFNFQKIGLGGSVKRKIKTLWPKAKNYWLSWILSSAFYRKTNAKIKFFKLFRRNVEKH